MANDVLAPTGGTTSVLIKCDPGDIGPGKIITVREWPYEKARVSIGEEAFVWLSETAGGHGLAMRGVVRQVEGADVSVGLTIEIFDRKPLKVLSKVDLKPFRDDETTTLGRLARKIYRSSLNKIAKLLPDESEFLGGFFERDIASDSAMDIAEIQRDLTVDSTTRETLIQARLGQGRFRADLLGKWDGKCAVTGCAVREVLRASHIKPWRACNNVERLNSDNGLLLVAQLDAMFDVGFVSFRDDGKLILSREWPITEREFVPLEGHLAKKPNRAQRTFLDFHRTKVFKQS